MEDMRTLALAAKRPVYFVSRHDNLTLQCFTPTGHTLSVLAETDPHGRWIQ
jgi:hypothetical protein